jgi:hypothetical protein
MYNFFYHFIPLKRIVYFIHLLNLLFLYRNHSKMTEKDQRLIDELKHNIQRLIISLDKTKEELQKSRENFLVFKKRM